METGICAKCGTAYQAQQVVCMKCGNLLFDPTSSTVHIRIDPGLLRLRRNRPSEVTTLGAERTVRLQIRGLSERLTFEEDTEIVLGRIDLSNPVGSRLDLTPYGAHERGVSREHAVMRFRDGELTITDLGSVNGTSVNLKRLQPNKPHRLKDGNDVLLGRLSIVIRFEAMSKSPETLDDSNQDLTKPLPVIHFPLGNTAAVDGAPVSNGKPGSRIATQQLDDSKVPPTDNG